MHSDLVEVIATAKIARDAVIAKKITVKEANSVASNNHSIVMSHALDLRERLFLADYQGKYGVGNAPPEGIADQAINA